ncbi:bifunctional folylpolyglutamate synthase/dihydrofolate synthase [Bythopirellula goksoeyrii]|uniref:Dihydrofolate synthase/folylpolyglutamate synthase n=1 Tax=Bythopirellula goksoeyrii TaxID=1400387 RepID=A0A5B9Q4Q2_9BACT|nr:folylpolyglutamate synthase/dihydrofolate synthase family protein [Bythopirellula goksoeyrii]QEG34014.1 Folylpolyglutamate synthase [Bythopirellula goksoeyrii]
MTLSSPAETASAPCPHQQASEFLLGRINYERTAVLPYGKRHMKLDRMRTLLTRLGNPDAGMPIVHVAGTKGKGSTSAMIAGVLQAAGYRTGLFSSPHLESIEERFQVDSVPCPGDQLVALVDRLRPVVEEMDREAVADGSLGPTYFELVTAIALMHFSQQKVDITVLEVGLGGRLDSTNVCQSTVTVITSISLDHTKQLGSTVEEIAREKAGIIKPGVPLLCGPLETGPRNVISEIAQQHGSRMIEAGREFHYTYRPPLKLEKQDRLGSLDFEGDMGSEDVQITDIPLRMLGEHQAANAALAIATASQLRKQGWRITSDAICDTFSKLTLPGRIELICRRPAVVLDVAHNVAAVEALVEVLATSFSCSHRVLLLAATRDKDVRGIVRVLVPHFERVIVTQYHDNPRAVATEKLGKIVRAEIESQKVSEREVVENPDSKAAWQIARKGVRRDDLICVTGSFFVVAELRSVIYADA